MMTDGDTRRRQLGAFLRARREAARVEGAAPGAGRRRRTPGLRREEVADLAGISAVWYVRIEQGREVAPSPAALSRLAKALRLNRAERAHLFELAGRRDPDGERHAVSADLPPDLEAAVMTCRGAAYLLDGLWSVWAMNEGARDLFVDWRGEAVPNLLRYVFLDPASRRFIHDWEERAARVVAEFRRDHARQPGAAAEELVAQLIEGSAVFAARWKAQAVLGREGGLRLFDHPLRGRLAFRQTTFLSAEEPDYKLIMLLPAGE